MQNIVDFHAHILPGADHGSSCAETTKRQMQLALDAGVTRIIATPHFYPHKHTLEQFLLRRKAAYDKLAELHSDVDVKLGAEVLLCAGLENFQDLDKLCFNGTNFMLLELPFSDFRSEYSDTAKKILKSGIEIILAHVDRYPRESIESMMDVGVKHFQVNADALTKLFKPRHLLEWAKGGNIVALGSDIHNADKAAYRRFRKAERVLGDAVIGIKDYSDKVFEQII